MWREASAERGTYRVLSADRSLSDIQRHDEHGEIQDADVAVEIERALHLRQIVGRHQRLLVNEHSGDNRDAGKVHGPERHDEAERKQTRDGDYVHATRNRDRSANPEPYRDRLQAVDTVE